MKKGSLKVKNVTPEGLEARMKFTQVISSFGSLGREIKISPKSNIALNEAGYKVKYYVDTVSICIGIGRDHSAELIMTKDAWEALNRGEELNIDTKKQFLKKFSA